MVAAYRSLVVGRAAIGGWRFALRACSVVAQMPVVVYAGPAVHCLPAGPVGPDAPAVAPAEWQRIAAAGGFAAGHGAFAAACASPC